jgi:hypothetical protein
MVVRVAVMVGILQLLQDNQHQAKVLLAVLDQAVQVL